MYMYVHNTITYIPESRNCKTILSFVIYTSNINGHVNDIAADVNKVAISFGLKIPNYIVHKGSAVPREEIKK